MQFEFLLRFGWEDPYHPRVCALNIKLQRQSSCLLSEMCEWMFSALNYDNKNK